MTCLDRKIEPGLIASLGEGMVAERRARQMGDAWPVRRCHQQYASSLKEAEAAPWAS